MKSVDFGIVKRKGASLRIEFSLAAVTEDIVFIRIVNPCAAEPEVVFLTDIGGHACVFADKLQLAQLEEITAGDGVHGKAEP